MTTIWNSTARSDWWVSFMSKSIKPEDIGKALTEQLTIYHSNIVEKINAAGEDAVKTLVQKTKATAPKDRGEYRKQIASQVLKKSDRGNTYAWYVRPPGHRLTHLLVHGHATKDGGRTKADPFLKNACDDVLPEFEKSVEEAIKHD